MKGSSCKIFSESQQKWQDGTIVNMLPDGYLTVHYGDNEKDIHIDSKNIKIIDNTDDNLSVKLKSSLNLRPQTKTTSNPKPIKGASCKIYSESQKKWFDGEIVKVLEDDHITIRYNGNKEKDIRISSKNVKISSDSNSNSKSKPKSILKPIRPIVSTIDDDDDNDRNKKSKKKRKNKKDQKRKKNVEEFKYNTNKLPTRQELTWIERIARGALSPDKMRTAAGQQFNQFGTQTMQKPVDPYKLQCYQADVAKRKHFMEAPEDMEDEERKRASSLGVFNYLQRMDEFENFRQSETGNHKFEYEWSQSTKAAPIEKEKWVPMKPMMTAPQRHLDDDSMDVEAIRHWKQNHPNQPQAVPTIQPECARLPTCPPVPPPPHDDEYAPDSAKHVRFDDEDDKSADSGGGCTKYMKPWMILVIIIFGLCILGGYVIMKHLNKKKEEKAEEAEENEEDDADDSHTGEGNASDEDADENSAEKEHASKGSKEEAEHASSAAKSSGENEHQSTETESGEKGKSGHEEEEKDKGRRRIPESGEYESSSLSNTSYQWMSSMIITLMVVSITICMQLIYLYYFR